MRVIRPAIAPGRLVGITPAAFARSRAHPTGGFGVTPPGNIVGSPTVAPAKTKSTS